MWIRRGILTLVGMVVAWWLFADTYARHARNDHGATSIRFSHFGTVQDYELWRDIIVRFQRRQPGLSVRQEYIVGIGGQYDTKLHQQVLTGSLPDVVLIQFGPFHSLADHFSDLTDVTAPSEQVRAIPENVTADESRSNTPIASLLDRTAVEAFRCNGRLRGLPVSGGSLLIYGNRRCFERASRFHGRPILEPDPQWTIEDFRATAAALTCDFDNDGKLDQFGFWLPKWVYYLPFLWSFGAELADEDGTTWAFVGPSAERAVAFYASLAMGDRVCPRDDEVPQLFQDTAFLTGRVSMCVNGPWFQPFLDRTRLASEYFVAPIPAGPAGRRTRVTWDGVVIPAGLAGPRRDRAEQFVQFILSREVQESMARTGRALPARRDALPAYLDSGSEALRQPFVDALGYSRLQPQLTEFRSVDRTINRYLCNWFDRTTN